MSTAHVIDLPRDHAGDDVLSRLRVARELLSGIAQDVVAVVSADLAGAAAEVAGVVAAADAAQAAIVLEACSRGVIAASDHPRPQRWVEQSYREAGTPVARRTATDLHDVALTCADPDADLIRQAVTSGTLPIETAGLVASIYRRLRRDIECSNWDALAREIVDGAASGASPVQLRHLEDRLLGQYGTAGALDDTHERMHRLRDMSGFRVDRAGMMIATLRLDPASEAVLTAALDALSAPRPVKDDRGDVVEADLRTPGQRRADALIDLARLATRTDPTVPGTGAKARVTVTMSFTDLRDALGAAATDLGHVLSPAEARTLACDADIVPAVLGSTNEVLDLGRATRLITPGQRTALILRDNGCTYPGCDAPPGWCDGHHIRHWAEGGTTDPPNLALLCRHHHTVVHRHGHAATVDGTGVHWTRADGTPIGTTPRGWW